MTDHVEQVPQSRFQRLLFVDSHLPTSLPAPRAHERFVITALLRRRTDVSSRAFYRQVENDLASRLHHERGDLGLASLKVYRDVSAGGILSFFLQITRSHAYTAFLCRVLRRAPPPPYRIRYGVLFDNVVQITFERHPESSQLDGVLGLLRSPEISAAECTILGSVRQYTVYDAHPGGSESKRVVICFLVNRPIESTRDACQAYWRTQHADLALRNMAYLGLTRYLQVQIRGISTPHSSKCLRLECNSY